MDITIHPSKLRGTVRAIPSKSQAHRLLICSAFSDRETTLHCPQTNKDIAATVDCLNALGAGISRTPDGYRVVPAKVIPGTAALPCGESGSTLRFLLPVVGALGIDAVFMMEGRLPSRPLSPLWELMERKGCSLSRPTENTIRCTGRLVPGNYSIAGNVSSQFISGLLFAGALMPGECRIHITGTLESAPYVEMTRLALAQFGLSADDFIVNGIHGLHSPGNIKVEGDWSNAAFFLAAGALGNTVEVDNLNPLSPQGDRAIARILPQLDGFCRIDAADIPDLVPILAVTAGAKHGAVFHNIGRLRLKESDRVASVCRLLESLGGKVTATEDTLEVYPAKYHGGTVDSFNDHRIAMSAAVAATVCEGDVTILGAQCTEKSYPDFWNVYKALGGNYE